MKHISVLVPAGSSIVDTIIAPYNLLKMANTYYKRLNKLKTVAFQVDLVGLSEEPVVYQGLFSVQPTATIHEVLNTDLIIVSPLSGDMEKELFNNREFVPWIRKQRIENDAEIASLCKGAFLLAETGLLNGKSCATHWTAHEQFQRRYPAVHLMPEKIICEDNGIYSSGGAYSILNFTLYLIERYFGREVAIWCSKLSEIEFDRVSQSEFIIFSGQKGHTDESIKKAQHYIENNYQQKLSISKIAEKVNMNGRSFLRRFKKATANTPLEYIQRVKIEAAKKKLESSTDTILEVMYGVGYIDEKAFRTTFRKYCGLSPKAYRNKYNRELAFSQL
ncbi:GlxA family transcriptional regulator [Muriicola sp. Z0-33]|uniref:GlxA family transcriptional regulator n=1 Tax=Muriicola sp. Z0-33 TaxID=2816957 RepID=UPI002238CED2|nr:helix-turn-helix domain-containing protein [Muriicola sp. Z0-33]MCW5515999.1 helix-turn-helix domain-containing protein [Muriicola sp. Z0-33]